MHLIYEPIKWLIRKITFNLSRLSTLTKFLGILFKNMPFQCSALVFIIVIQGIMPAVSIKLSAYIVDSLGSTSLQGLRVLWLCGLWAASLLLYDLINPWVLFFQGNIADKAVFHINYEIIKKSNAIEGLKAFEDPSFHDNIQIIQSQASHKPLNLVVTLVGLAKDIVLIVSCATLLFMQIHFLAVAIVASAYIHFKVFSAIQNKAWQESLGRSPKSRFANYISSLSISPASAKEIRLFGMGGYLLSSYKKIFTEIYNNIFKLRLKHAYFPILPFLLSAFINFIAFYFVVNKVNAGLLHFGAFLILLQGLTQLHLSISSFGEQAGWLTGHLLFFEKFFNFQRTEEKVFKKVPSQQNGKNVTKEVAKIEKLTFKNVSFSYSDDGPQVLKDLNFTINAKEKIAIVGANGAGKTTLIKLLCGFYQPTEGQILVNDIPLTDLNIVQWQKIISPVFQDFSKYNLSFKENIIMGAQTLDEAKFQKVVQECRLNEVLSFLNNNINQQLGQSFGGPDLSGGQWQRLAIARALYKEAQIYILDEPTASLDPIIEHEIFNLFNKISKDKLSVFITHRLGSISMTDKIFVLEDGCLKETGTHLELMKKNSYYKEMFTLQSQNYLALEKEGG